MAEEANRATDNGAIDMNENENDAEQSESEDTQAQENECGNATIANGNNVAATKECPIAKELNVQDEMCDDETYEDKSYRLDVISDNMNDLKN